MKLDIQSTKLGQPVTLETWDGLPLSSAIDHAKVLVANDLADRVEIRHEGKLVGHWPRALRAG